MFSNTANRNRATQTLRHFANLLHKPGGDWHKWQLPPVPYASSLFVQTLLSLPRIIRRVEMQSRHISTVFSAAFAVAVLMLTAGSVAAQDVKYNAMPGTDFSKFHTYK